MYLPLVESASFRELYSKYSKTPFTQDSLHALTAFNVYGFVGGGAAQIVMPYLTLAIAHRHPLFHSWRYAFFVPASAHIIMAMLVLFFGQVCLNPMLRLIKQ